MPDSPFTPVEQLTASHTTDAFDCGKPPLDDFLRRFALASARSDSSRTYVVCRAGRVAGYYTLAVGSVLHEGAPTRVAKGLPKHPIPVMILARLAVDRKEQGAGLGKALLKNALLRTAVAAEFAGIRAMLVHAKDEEARAWYLKYSFEPGPTDPFHLFLPMKDIRASLAR